MADLQGMGHPQDWQRARLELRDRVGADPALRTLLADDSADVTWEDLEQLLARRLERAAAEAREGNSGNAHAEPSLVVREILASDLVAHPGATPGGRMISECDDMVLRHVKVPEQLVTSRVLRCYVIEDAAGREIGLVHQIANHDFDVLDRNIGQTYVFRQSGDQLYVLDETGGQFGFVNFKEDEPRADFKVISSMDRGMLHVRRNAERPYRLEVLGSVGDEIGAIERRFVGLAPFDGDANCIRIRVVPGRVSPGQRLGLLAVGLLAGIGDEES